MGSGTEGDGRGGEEKARRFVAVSGFLFDEFDVVANPAALGDGVNVALPHFAGFADQVVHLDLALPCRSQGTEDARDGHDEDDRQKGRQYQRRIERHGRVGIGPVGGRLNRRACHNGWLW